MEKKNNRPNGALASLAVLLSTGPIWAQTTPGFELNFDAQDPASAPGASSWLSTTADSSQDFEFGVDVTLETVASSLSGISRAYRFTGGDADADNPTWNGLFGEGDATTWEFWLKPADTGDPAQMIYESGGSGTGFAVWYEVGTDSDGTGTLNFTIDGGSAPNIVTVSAGIDTSEFRQIVLVYDESAGGGAIDVMQIYVDGILVDDNLSSTTFDDVTNDIDSTGLDDYCGGDGTGIGNTNNSFPETVFDGEFEGDLSIFRVYGSTALTAAEVLANYNALAGPDTTDPALTGLSPADDALDAPLGDLMATFNEPVEIASGDIRIVNETDNVTTTITVPDAQVTISNLSNLVISPSAALIGGKDYHVEIDSGVVQDLAGNVFPGIVGIDDWDFSTDGTPPTVDSFANNKSGGVIYDNDSVIYTVTFNEAMNASTIEVGDFGNSASATATITVDSVSQISENIYEVVVSPTSTGMIQLQVNASANLEDVAGNGLDTSASVEDPTTINVIPFVSNSASLELDFQETVASEEFNDVDNTWGDTTPGRFWHISVNPNNVGYASYIALDASNNAIPPYIRSFSNPVEGWSFIGGGTNGDLTVSEESGGLISWTTTDETDPISNTFDSFGMNQKKFWNATDPGSDFNLPADETEEGVTTQDKQVTGYRSFGQATATIDVSGLSSGKVIIFYGAFSATPQVDAILRDSSGLEPDIVLAELHLNGDFANRTEYYAAEVDFATDGVYDTIVHNYLQPGGEPDGSGNGRSGGIAVLGEGSGYGSWANGPFAGTLTDSTSTLDFDGGGLDTGIEWVVGGDPTDGSDDADVAPTFSSDDETSFNFIYRISDEASEDPNTTVLVEYGDDLVGWTTASDNDGTIEIITADGTGADEGFNIVTVQIDRSLALDAVLFARLNVVVTGQ